VWWLFRPAKRRSRPPGSLKRIFGPIRRPIGISSNNIKQISLISNERSTVGKRRWTAPGCAGRTFTAADAACIEAFERSRPPYSFRRGSYYRYRLDRTGQADRPIILERFERSEITGALLGIPFTSQRQGLLMRFCLWIEKKLQERQGKMTGGQP